MPRQRPNSEAEPTGNSDNPFLADIRNAGVEDVGRFRGLVDRDGNCYQNASQGRPFARFEVTNPESEFHGMQIDLSLTQVRRLVESLSGVNTEFASLQRGQLVAAQMELEQYSNQIRFGVATGAISPPSSALCTPESCITSQSPQTSQPRAF